MLNEAQRPVILLGQGVRLAGADAAPLLELGAPVLTSWLGKDCVDNFHPNYYGSPGVYGQRMANKVLHEADFVLAIGNRMSIWNVGYDGLRKDQRLVMVDIDAAEVEKFPQADWVKQDAKEFIEAFPIQHHDFGDWYFRCNKWREQYPLVESPAHDDREGAINSYRFMSELQKHLKPDSIIVTDAGGACCSAWQVLQVKPPQRMMTSGGLGEMGCGLPAAIGAAVATGREVICIVGDGAMMLNLQELATIAHNNLPVKIIVFANDGYGMIKRSQDVMGMEHTAVGRKSGVWIPSFFHLATKFGIEARNMMGNDTNIRWLMEGSAPKLLAVGIHPDQPFVPKLNPVMVDGKPTPPRFCDMSPLL